MKHSAIYMFFAVAALGASATSHQPLREFDGWNITTRSRSDDYRGATVANGQTGMLVWREPFRIPHVMVNRLDDQTGPEGISQMVRGVNPFGLSLSIDSATVEWDNITDWQQTVEMHRGAISTSFVAAGGAARVRYTVYALRQMPNCGLIDVDITATRPISVCVTDTIEVPDCYVEPHSHHISYRTKARNVNAIGTTALTQFRHRLVAASASFVVPDPTGVVETVSDHRMSLQKSLAEGESLRFALVGSVVADRECLDPLSEADRLTVFANARGIDALIARHEADWADLWQGDIEIDGDDDAQQLARFSLYNLYSNVRAGSRSSIPPFGLSLQQFNGHIFWDTELWMFPPIALLAPDLARSMMDYRIDALPAARARAARLGYRGAMFPWEADSEGQEGCPTYGLIGTQEQHITADVALGAWNFFRATADTLWLRQEGWPLIRDVADFWVSRVEPNADGSFSIRNVVCADEFAEEADDNAYTNAVVSLALQAAAKAADLLGLKADPQWARVADSLVFNYFPDGVMMEHARYAGETIKQADVNLLAYPLGIMTDPGEISRNLQYYEPKIAPGGPAMSYAILALQHSRLGHAEEAARLFDLAYKPHQRPPFGCITEGAYDGTVYFATGAGGFLQCIINGFGGLELTDRGIRQVPSALPPHWRRLTIKGVGPHRLTFTRQQP